MVVVACSIRIGLWLGSVLVVRIILELRIMMFLVNGEWLVV